MQQKYNSSTSEFSRFDVIPIGQWLEFVWNARWAVVIITLMTMAFTVGWAKLHATYKSEGFFQFGGPIPIVKEKSPEKKKDMDHDMEAGPGISLPDYKRYAASFATSERFADYLSDKKMDSVLGSEELRQVFSSRAGIGRMVEPIYPYTKLDAKDLMEQPKGNNNNVIGLRISYESDSPRRAQQAVALLGQYVMDSIVYFIYADAIRFKQDEIKMEVTKLDNIVIKNRIQLEQYQRKAAGLKKIIASNPDAANNGARQVVEVSEETARYLPPATLLTTTLVQIYEANEAIVKARLDQQRHALLLAYFDRVRKVMDATKSGETLLRGLELAKEDAFKVNSRQDDVVKEVYNMISVDNQTAINLYFGKSRFIAGPTLPQYSSTRMSLALAVGLIFGFFLSMMFLFGRHLWRSRGSL